MSEEHKITLKQGEYVKIYTSDDVAWIGVKVLHPEKNRTIICSHHTTNGFCSCDDCRKTKED